MTNVKKSTIIYERGMKFVMKSEGLRFSSKDQLFLVEGIVARSERRRIGYFSIRTAFVGCHEPILNQG